MIIWYKEGIRIIPLLQVKSVVYQDLFNTAYVLASVGRLFSFSIVDVDNKTLPLQSDKKASEKLGTKVWNISPNTIQYIYNTNYPLPKMYIWYVSIRTVCIKIFEYWLCTWLMIWFHLISGHDSAKNILYMWTHIFGKRSSLRKQVPALSFRCQASW